MTAGARRAGVVVLVGLVLGTVATIGGAPYAGAATGGAGFTATKTVTRDNLEGGQNQVVDSRTVTVSVSTVSNLRSRQEIRVSWSGAHPTGGIISDQNSGDAAQEEYPFVLLECRGVDSTSVPASDQLSPQTCWTQTTGERFEQSYNTPFPPWRIDRYATAAQREAVVGQPATRPAACFTPAPAEYWVPFVAASGTVYPGGPNGCAGVAPEAANVGGLSLPSNTTYGVTEPNGSGSADFDVWTSEDNASLGCSDTVPCALVAVPVMGISCDATAAALPPADQPGALAADADSLCTETGAYQPGQIVQPTGSEDLAVSGALWWSASNWRNRITIPLSFAPPGNVCDIIGTGHEVDVYGSELMTQATTQWEPTFCLNPKLFRFKHVQTSEPEARNLLDAGNIEAAFVSENQAGGYSRPVVNAPVALTGFAITFTVDDSSGHPLTTLRLTPRLLAKLLTESYPAINAVKEEDPALRNNPLDITLDPEFQALNPTVTKGVAASISASTLLALSSQSDVIYALTSYINADPDARAWLNGKPDPWGMVVNPRYKGIVLPTNTWPLLDTFEPEQMYASDQNDCLYNDPVPYLPLVAAPLSRLADITEAMQFSLANSTTVCQQPVDGSSEGEKLVTLGRQTVGYRFMLGVTSYGDAERYQLATASLLTHVDAGTPTAFTSATGRTFVGPSNASLLAAARLLRPDAATGTWPVPYDTMRASAAGTAAYPGTMVVYAAVPTTGLPKVDAADYADLLRFAATTGQTPGSGNGELPPGYLPMTASDDLGALAAYTSRAATAVAAQAGSDPSVASSSAPATSTEVPPSDQAAPVTRRPIAIPVKPAANVTAGPTIVAASSTAPSWFGRTLRLGSGLASAALPIVLLVAVGAAVLAPAGAVSARVRGRLAVVGAALAPATHRLAGIRPWRRR